MLKWIVVAHAFFLIESASAFTLVSSSEPRFGSPKVVIDMADGACQNIGLTSNEVLDLAMQAANEYWNRVPTCALSLERGSVTGDDITGDTLTDAIAKVEAGHILIGCGRDTTDVFDTAASQQGTLAVGAITRSGGSTRGIVIINDLATSPFTSSDRSEQVATLAHELGHAFGLGHSGDPVALMYYAIGGKVQERLTIDDYDGCTYLYPHEKKIASCNSIALIDDSGAGGGGTMTAIFAFVLAMLAGQLLHRRV
jgi:hypothetical protein